MKNIWVRLGASFGFLGVLLGAFGAHLLADKLPAGSLAIYQTATLYLFIHALALVIYGIWFSQQTRSRIPGWGFSMGIVLFSGSLYFLALTGKTWLGAITPFGGVSFLIGWGALAWKNDR